MATTDTTRDQLAHVLDDLAQVVDNLQEEKLHDPTPCTKFDVEQLRDHVVGWVTNFAAGFADPHGQAPSADLSDYDVPGDPGSAVRRAADQLDAALRAGAAERPLRLGEAEMPGDMALSMILWEYQVHGWDLARSSGQPWSPPEAGVSESLEFAPGMLTEDYQGEGKSFGNRVAVSDDASPLDHLLGLSGRDPSWTP